MDYLHHFELNDDPFRNDHLDRFLWEVPSQSEALRRLDRGVRQGRGLIVLAGAVGSGKSVVARRLYEDLEDEMFEAGMMVVLRSHADSSWLLQRFAAQLGVEDPADQREALVGQIYERLAIIREDGRHAVLIIDDAQALATQDTLSELNALVKLEYEDRRILTLVLVGTSKLERAIEADAELAHHVEVKVRMTPFDVDETATHLGHRLTVAGGSRQILLPGAVAALRELSRGAPGRMNCLADNALFEAYLASRSEVTRTDVESACAALGWIDGADETSEPARTSRDMRAAGRATGQAETTSPDMGVAEIGELDSELDAVFQSPGEAPEFPHASIPLASAAPTEIQLGPADALDGPPKEDDAVDDLFMELIDD